MRLQISLDDDLVRDLDLRVGRSRRSAFIACATAINVEEIHRGLRPTKGRLPTGCSMALPPSGAATNAR
jgi:metal-responsive CopG/Arc/MetJ family transcriptional regulator